MPSRSPSDDRSSLTRSLPAAVPRRSRHVLGVALGGPARRSLATLAVVVPLAAAYWWVLWQLPLGLHPPAVLVGAPALAALCTVVLCDRFPSTPLPRTLLTIATLATTVTAGTLAGLLLVAPLLGRHPDVAYSAAGVTVDSLPGRFLLSAAGCWIGLATVRLLNRAGRLLRSAGVPAAGTSDTDAAPVTGREDADAGGSSDGGHPAD